MFEEVARSHALLVERASEIETEVLNPDAWEEVLGAPLAQAVGATFFLQVAANANAGRLDPLWFGISGLEPILRAWPRDGIEQRAEALSSSFPEFRIAYDTIPIRRMGSSGTRTTRSSDARSCACPTEHFLHHSRASSCEPPRPAPFATRVSVLTVSPSLAILAY
jgi:hypothetical protein